MPLYFLNTISPDMVRYYRGVSFVFGDNEMRLGTGGTAKYGRGQPNTIGIRTKKAPGTKPGDYWWDTDFDSISRHIAMIDEDMARVIDKLMVESLVVFPANNVGTGLARLPETASYTYAYLTMLMDKLCEEYGVSTSFFSNLPAVVPKNET